MKKLSMICGITLVLALGVRPALAAKFQLDFYDDTQGLYSQGDFETSIDLSEGDTVYADIWVTGIAEGQLVGTIDTKLLWDSSALEVVFIDNSHLFSQANGLWDAAPFSLVRPGNMFLEVILFSGGNPGPEIMMHTIAFRCIAVGEDLIEITSNGIEEWFDENSVPIIPYPDELAVTVRQIECQEDGECDDEIECMDDADCDDDLFCNGEETCEDGACQPGTDPCSAQICNEDTNSCKSTPETTTTTIPVDSTTTTIDIEPIDSGLCPSEKLYGEDSEEVEVLRYFRDSVLSTTPEGRELIRLYYQWSPAITMAIQNDETFKEKVKKIIDGVLLLIIGEAK